MLPASLPPQKGTVSQAPAKPEVCVSPERAYCRQASQEALKKSAACITCPAARKRAPFVQDYLSGNRKVGNLFPPHSMLEAKAFYSPQQTWGCHFAKAYKSKTPPLSIWKAGAFSVFCCARRVHVEKARRQSGGTAHPCGISCSNSRLSNTLSSCVVLWRG